MHDTTQDHELERLLERYHANRESRIFAPLADRYRKLGHLDQALRICKRGLILHPEYSSAHVILAKIHLDRGEPEAAGAGFQRVLELDPQNLLALGTLGELAEAADHPQEALVYWERLLELDPMHEEAQSRVELARRTEAAAAPPVEAPEAPAETSRETPPAPAPPESPRTRRRNTDKEDELVEGIATRTLADIYYEQGFKAKALTIYEGMLHAAPTTPHLREKVERIRTELARIESHQPAEVGDVEELEKPKASETTKPKTPTNVLAARFVDEPVSGPLSPVGEGDADDDAEDFTNFKSWLEKNQVRP